MNENVEQLVIRIVMEQLSVGEDEVIPSANFTDDLGANVIDKAVQLHGGDGVRHGHIIERLYREIRALRIYEGASEVQKVVIARQTIAGA